MVVRVAINGFGRIGRLVLRAALQDKKIKVVAINDLTDTATLATLFKYDSVQGTYPSIVNATGHYLHIGKNRLHVYAEKEPAHLPWKDLKIDVVAECTGRFTTLQKASKHIDAGAKKVVLSAPCKCDTGKKCALAKTIVYGVNHTSYRKKDKVVSNASCTTNCIAPMLKVLHNTFGVEHALFNTAHGYTSTQQIVDGPHKDLRRARAAAVNIVPTTSGASISVERVLPSLKGKLQGFALRVPIPVGSLSQIVCTTKKKVTIKTVNHAFKKASLQMKGILKYSEEPLVSSDIVGDPHSVIFDAPFTKVMGNNMVSILGWYDNEWGFSNRMIDTIKLLGK
jgi:glyceraldehyde 3-phosphate dehydrogenase